jgi:hypothetical protein
MRKYVQYMTYTVKNRLKGPRKMATSFNSTASNMHGINTLCFKIKKKLNYLVFTWYIIKRSLGQKLICP